MCGLPGSGKTQWVREHSGSNADKRYTVIGNSSLLERMTVSDTFFMNLKNQLKTVFGLSIIYIFIYLFFCVIIRWDSNLDSLKCRKQSF